ncbi:hypothetical protein RND71_035726 [Anisodus tanguticus]|uniref:Uncharacterized protein n=1 Tax=Anisodus tanguticus TaxID=243964 RepID=A0AAE1V2F8_9SOLA|nr:hypothetical protein RND71_035726 [Anisodus tanguticus]
MKSWVACCAACLVVHHFIGSCIWWSLEANCVLIKYWLKYQKWPGALAAALLK